MTTLFVVAQANTPHHADKTKLLKPNLRPGAFYESIEDARDGRPFVCGVNEMWPGILLPVDGYDAMLPFPNNVRPTALGNGFVWTEETIAAKKPTRQVTQRINTGTGPRTIHLPLVRFRPLGQRQVVPILNVHAPRMKDDAAGNRRTHEAAIEKGQRVAKRTGRCLVLGDPNDPHAKARYEAAGYQCLQHGIGFIAAIGDVQLRNFQAISRGVLNVWSDHLLLTADVVTS